MNFQPLRLSLVLLIQAIVLITQHYLQFILVT